MEQVIRAEEQKVKVFKVSDPNQIRYVTKVAAGYLAPKWAIADIQDQPKKREDVKVVDVTAVDNKPALREEYKKVAGVPADERWNEARLYVEISKVKSQAKATEDTKTDVAEEKIMISEPKQKRKYTKRQIGV